MSGCKRSQVKGASKNLDLSPNYGVKFNRKSAGHLEVEDKALKGSLKAAHVLTYQHSVRFDDGKQNLYDAYKLENIAVPEKLPDTFFLLPIISNTAKVQYVLVQMV